MGRLVDALCAPVNAHRRAEDVGVRDLVPHDEHRVLAAHDLLERLGLDTRLDTGIFLHRLRLPAEVAGVVALADDHLVAAAAKRKLNRPVRGLRIFQIGIRAEADAHGNGHGRLISNVDGFDILQDLEALALQLVKALLSDQEEIVVVVSLPDKAVHIRKIPVDLALNERQEQGLLQVITLLDDLVVVVETEKPEHEAVGLRLLAKSRQLRLIEEVERDGRIVVRDGVGIRHQLLHDNLLHGRLVNLVLIGHRTLGLRILAGQLILRNFREDCGNRAVVAVLPPGDAKKLVVHPEDVAVKVEQGIRQDKFPQDAVLDLTVARSEVQQLARNPRPLHAIEENRGRQVHDEANAGGDGGPDSGNEVEDNAKKRPKGREPERPL